MTTNETVPPAPHGLDEAGRKLWEDMTTVYELAPGELRILHDACSEADLIAALEADWVRQGRPMETRGSRNQLVAHPAIAELRQHRLTMRSLLTALKLPRLDEDEDAPNGVLVDMTRPMTRTESARKAAKAKWDRYYNHG